MIKISLGLPIRGSLMEFERLVQSLIDTTADLSQIELVLASDKCDTVFTPLIPMYKEKYKDLNIQFHVVERSKHFIRDYYNFTTLKGKGRWCMAINVDCLFMTKGWDNIICNKMEEAANIHGDDFIYGIVKDALPRSGNPEDEALAKKHNKALWHKKIDFSCWVLTSSEFVHWFGGIMDERNWLWGADHWMGIAWQKVKKAERVVMIREVFIDDISHHTKNMPQPESFEYFCQIMRDHPMIYTHAMAQEVANRIVDQIEYMHNNVNYKPGCIGWH